MDKREFLSDNNMSKWNPKYVTSLNLNPNALQSYCKSKFLNHETYIITCFKETKISSFSNLNCIICIADHQLPGFIHIHLIKETTMIMIIIT